MKKIIIPLMIMLCAFAFTVSADPLTVNLDPYGNLPEETFAKADFGRTPGTNSNSVQYNFNVTGNSSAYYCELYTTEDGASGAGSFVSVATVTSVNNDTQYNFSVRNNIADINLTGGESNYTWGVLCNATGDMFLEQNWSVTNQSFGVDITAPNIAWDSVFNPDEKWFTTTNGVVFNMTGYELNPAMCRLTLSINASHGGNNGTQLMNYNSSAQTRVYINGTQFTYEAFNGSATGTAFLENGTGAYKYNAICNDTAGNTATPFNQTFFVDATAPGAFDINMSQFFVGMRNAYSGANGTDYTPELGFEKSLDANISRYEVTFYNSTFGAIPGTINLSVSANSLNTTTQNLDPLLEWTKINMSTLLSGIPYVIVITAFDLAGNNVNATTVTNTYWATDINRDLKTGWNIISNPATTINGSNFLLQDIRNWTGATTVSLYNSTHEFVSHTLGGTNGAVEVAAGQPVFIYVASDTTFSDLIWNTTLFPSIYNLTTQDSSNYSIVVNYNYTVGVKRFQGIDNYINSNGGISIQNDTQINVSYLSFYNNTASSGNKYIPFKSNWSYNNATQMRFSEVTWMLMEQGKGVGYAAGATENHTPVEKYAGLHWTLVGGD